MSTTLPNEAKEDDSLTTKKEVVENGSHKDKKAALTPNGVRPSEGHVVNSDDDEDPERRIHSPRKEYLM